MKWPDLRRLDGYLPPEMEKAYRQFYLQADLKVTRISMTFFALLVAAFAYNDYVLFGPTPTFHSLVTLRGLYLAYFIALMIYLGRNRSPGRFDLSVFVAAIAGLVLAILVNLTRPSAYLGSFAVEIVLILTIYLGAPIRLLFRVLAALAITLAEVLSFTILRQLPSAAAFYAAIVALVMANLIGLYGSSRIYSLRRSAFRGRVEQEQTSAEILDLHNNAPAGYHSLDKDGVFVLVNDTELSWLGYSREELVGKQKFADFMTPESRKVLEATMPMMQKGRGWLRNQEYDLIRRDGTLMTVLVNAAAVKDAQGNYLMSRTTVFDVTEVRRLQRQIAESEEQHRAMLEQMAMHDSLTGLANRSMLYDRFKVAQAQAQRSSRMMALMEFDLDHFKIVNDTMGHAAGDELLKATAARIESVTRGSDTFARLGGDEFAVLMPEVSRAEDAIATARKILVILNRPFTIDGHELNVSASIGIAIYPENGLSIDDLLKAADEAMYYTKGHGRNGYKLAGPAEKQ